ncbi:hypothetical protein RY35_20870 [Salmonella enterica subsp. enterica serovar Kentucky]|nr:hypothetical protein [Salmonella enterica subsp. enterica serovar Kentucky]
MAKNFVDGISSPGLLKRDVVTPAPRKVHSGKQAAGVARPERSLQAWFFRHRTVAAARNRASGFGGDWRVRQQLPVGVGPDDRMPPGSREPKVSPPPEIRTTETT